MNLPQQMLLQPPCGFPSGVPAPAAASVTQNLNLLGGKEENVMEENTRVLKLSSTLLEKHMLGMPHAERHEAEAASKSSTLLSLRAVFPSVLSCHSQTVLMRKACWLFNLSSRSPLWHSRQLFTSLKQWAWLVQRHKQGWNQNSCPWSP